MNPFDFMIADGGGSLMPVVIFIIWIIISVVGNSKAKKKKLQITEKRRIEEEKRRQQAETEEAPYEEPSEPEPALARESGQEDLAGDLERQIETIFGTSESGETDNAIDEQPAYDEAPEGELSPASPAAPATTFMPQLTTPVPDSAPSFFDQQLATLEAVSETEPLSVNTGSLDDARKGVLWSEILAPCKALRDE
jgi:hypothetical protein